MQKTYFGIDFGTTNTAVVQLLVDEYGKKIVNCGEDGLPFPSMLAINKEDATILFGRRVKTKRQQLARDHYIVSSLKSKLGKEERIEVAGKTFTATDFVTYFFKSVKDYIAEHMGIEVREATFAVPVNFGPDQRRELKRAAEAAGIKVNKLITESTAAYLRNRDLVKGMSKVAVFDWGGGTLDISVLEIEKDILRELAIHGTKIGGDDIDKLLAKKVHGEIASKHPEIGCYEDMSDIDRDKIITKCEDAKIALSKDYYFRINLIDYGLPGFTAREPLELDRFSEIIDPYIDAAVQALYEAIEKAGISVAQLDAIIMVGGSCEMQPIQERIANLFGSKNIKIVYPEQMQWSVAVGTSMVDTMDSSYKLNQSIGVILSDNSFFPLIEKHKPVPYKADEIRFGVVEETTDAHFIICDDRLNTLQIANVPIKGFLAEDVCVNTCIDEDLMACLTLKSTHMGREKVISLRELGFYYDLSGMAESKTNPYSEKTVLRKEKKDKLCCYSDCNEKVFRNGYCSHHFKWEYADSK